MFRNLGYANALLVITCNRYHDAVTANFGKFLRAFARNNAPSRTLAIRS